MIPTSVASWCRVGDVTDQRAHERELYEAAYRDPLTGLPNREKISEDLRELMDDETALAVAFLGIDRFNLINDSLGHTTGDVVLQAVSARVRSSVPASSVVGRFGGRPDHCPHRWACRR
jgi:diguanylate cyclase (GGDEF)-like protein